MKGKNIIKNLFKPRLKKVNYSICPVCNKRLSYGMEPAHLLKEHPDYKSDWPDVIVDEVMERNFNFLLWVNIHPEDMSTIHLHLSASK